MGPGGTLKNFPLPLLKTGDWRTQRTYEQKLLNWGPYSLCLLGTNDIPGTFLDDRRTGPVSCKSDRVRIKFEAKICAHRMGSWWAPRSRLLSGKAPLQDITDHGKTRSSGLYRGRPVDTKRLGLLTLKLGNNLWATLFSPGSLWIRVWGKGI